MTAGESGADCSILGTAMYRWESGAKRSAMRAIFEPHRTEVLNSCRLCCVVLCAVTAPGKKVSTACLAQRAPNHIMWGKPSAHRAVLQTSQCRYCGLSLGNGLVQAAVLGVCYGLTDSSISLHLSFAGLLCSFSCTWLRTSMKCRFPSALPIFRFSVYPVLPSRPVLSGV